MSLGTVVKKVNDAPRRSQISLRRALESAKEAGEVLNEIKREKLYGKHGSWKPWLAKTFPEISYRQLAKYMRLAANWDEISSAIGDEAATINDALKTGAKSAATAETASDEVGFAGAEEKKPDSVGPRDSAEAPDHSEAPDDNPTRGLGSGVLSCRVTGRVRLAIEPLGGCTVAQIYDELGAGTAFVDQGVITKTEGDGAPMVIAKVSRVNE